MKKPVTLWLASALAALLLAGCAKSYAIRRGAGATLIDSCPQRAKAGETVTLRTVSVADGELRVSVNGDGLAPAEEAVYEFVMPPESVTIDISVSTEGYPGAVHPPHGGGVRRRPGGHRGV